jgi:hypothetical protein
MIASSREMQAAQAIREITNYKLQITNAEPHLNR